MRKQAPESANQNPSQGDRETRVKETGVPKKTGHFLVNSRRISPFYGEIRHWSAQRVPKRKINRRFTTTGMDTYFLAVQSSEAELDKADRQFRPYKWPFPGIFQNRFPILDEPIISRNLGTKKSDLA